MNYATPLSERARGRWTAILPALGISAKYLTGRHGPCPICGGKDRFRFDDREGKGTWICTHCGAGDGVKLVMLKDRVSFRDAAEAIEKIIGSVADKPISAPPRQRESAEERGEKARQINLAIWKAARPIDREDPVGKYLWARVRIDRYPPCLKYAERAKYTEAGEKPSWHPAMLALVWAPDGKKATIHRTYLTTDGKKAEVRTPRKLCYGDLPKGAAVRLMEHNGVLGIAEGIETAFAASKLFDVPCWAATNASALLTWIPPSDIREVVIFADNDPSFTGQYRAYSLAYRLKTEGVTVRSVEIPEDEGDDWNDVFKATFVREGD